MGMARAADEIHWNITGQTSVTFHWRGPENVIRYGLTTAYDRSVTAVTPDPLPFSSPGPFWEAELTGLTENTLYHYSIGSGPDHTFRTPPARGSWGFTVYAAGDIGDTDYYEHVAPVQALIAVGEPAFCLILGDLTYGNDHGQAAVDQHFNDVMVWSQGAAYMPAWGNHDWEPFDDLRNYKGRFAFPNSQTSPGAPAEGCCGEDWYWFDYGNTRFIAYPEPWPGAWEDWRQKTSQLMDQAQSDSAIAFVVTFGHRPAYSSGSHSGSGTLRSHLDALGSNHDKYVLNLNGHSHNYERSHPQSGVVHVTAGIGGATLEQTPEPCLWAGGCPPPAWSAFRAMHHGAVKLRFTRRRLFVEAICGPPGDSTDNRNDITCSPGDVMDAVTLLSPIPDAPPVVLSPATVIGSQDKPIRVTVTSSDPDEDPILTLTADLSALPAGHDATFTPVPDKTSGVLTWTPAAGHAGASYGVTFTAMNALAAQTTSVITVGPLAAGPLVEREAAWNYHDLGQDLGTVWKDPEHDDSAWSVGTAVLGYGESYVRTTVSYGPNPNYKHPTTYFRKRFDLADPARVQGLTLNLMYDDGVIAYLNGVEIARGSMPSGPVSYTTRASSHEAYQTYESFDVDAWIPRLVGGNNVLAAEVHQSSRNSSDLVFDAELIAESGGGIVDVPRAETVLLGASVFPNPTTGEAMLRFVTSRTGFVRVQVFDANGRHLRTLMDVAESPAGAHYVSLGVGNSAPGPAPGVYFYRVRAREGTAVGRFVILE